MRPLLAVGSFSQSLLSSTADSWSVWPGSRVGSLRLYTCKPLMYSLHETQVRVQLLRTLATWHCPHSPPLLQEDHIPAGPTAANLQRRHAAATWDRQTDKRTPDRCIDPAPHTIGPTDSANNFDRSVAAVRLCIKKGKGSPYSITKRRVPELIPVLGSQPAGDVNHKPGGGLPLLSARPAVRPTLATLKTAATSFAAW